MIDKNLREPLVYIPNNKDIKTKRPLVLLYKFKLNASVRKAVISILIVGVILLSLLGSIYYIFIYLSPGAIFARSLKNLTDAESSKYSAEIILDFSETPNPNSNKEINEESNLLKINQPSKYKLLSEGILRSDGGSLISDSKIQVYLDGNNIADIDLINSKNDLFIKLASFSYSGLMDQTILDNWIKVDNKYLEEKLGFDNFINLDPDNKNTEKISDKLITYPPFEIGDKYPSDKVKGVDTYHFKFSPNKENLKKNLNLSGDSYINNVDFKEGNLWIGKSKNKIIRIKGDMVVNNIGSIGTYLNITYDFIIYDLNNAPSFVFPENYLDITDLLK